MTVTPQLRSLFIPDFPLMSDPPRIEDPACFELELWAFVGPDNDAERTDRFEFVVCTPAWLANHVREGPQPLRGHIVVARWEPDLVDTIEHIVGSLCRTIEAPTWAMAAERLARYLRWEDEGGADES